ncbi:uncharacterized protein LOC120088079 isoform X2 [Benincasa hispida]|uniref:uncharacterized protein LOC120088079 isoform X2 n=1 Tax=Benincasa hispida TaxID=102211 RepID=UPI00190189EF|nr:uncharacterized protein LOC120088079 isoform X2 [Benincasa hispida]
MEKMMSLKHLFVTTFIGSLSTFMVIPSITDLTMRALCPGQNHCSLAIYLFGLQQVIIGLGAMVSAPVIGNLSDKYGRKTMLILPMTFSIIPLTIMAYRRTTNFFYAFYIMKTLTDMVSEGTTVSLTLAYVVFSFTFNYMYPKILSPIPFFLYQKLYSPLFHSQADKTSEEQRISAFGILSGVKSVGYVCGTFSARLLSIATVFQVATFMSVLAVVYMMIFLKESILDRNELTRPIFNENISGDDENGPQLTARNQLLTGISSIRDFICLITSSTTFSQIARVSFFNSLAEKGMQASLAFFLKARFHFDKNQFADLMIIDGIAGATSQLLLMPVLTPAIRQEKLLSIGLWASFVNVPYASRALSIFTVIVSPIIFNIASKQVGQSEQLFSSPRMHHLTSLASVFCALS